MDKTYDAIVIGLGAMGSAAAYQLAKRGARVVGIDQFDPPHTWGSSHGDTRITRLAIGEGAFYTPLVMRTHELWREIEHETGREILVTTGGLILSSTAQTDYGRIANFFQNTIQAAQAYHIAHTQLNADQIRARFPQFNLQADEVGYFEKEAGFVRPEAAIRAQLELAQKYGAQMHTHEKVLGYQAQAGKVVVKTTRGEYTAAKLILAAGAWLPELLRTELLRAEVLRPELSRFFKVYRQVLYWFDPGEALADFSPGAFPVFIWELQGQDRIIYGFPALEAQGGVKIATEQYQTTTSPETVDRHVGVEEIQAMYANFVHPYFPGLSSRCIKAVACLYTVTPDFGFVIDRHPEYENVILASPCSGHGFKHSAAIGEVLAQLVLDGRSEIDIHAFSLGRFGQVA